MVRINYLPPERRPRAEASRTLGLMVVWYLFAMFAGILLLGHLIAPVPPTTNTASARTLKK
jgi:hypothetical protein